MAAGRWAMMGLLIAGLLQSTLVEADTFNVGGDYGWTFPPNGIATFFDDWAKQYNFFVGDTLFFWYQFHSVLEVTQADYSSCTTSDPITSYSAAENATVTLDRPGYFAFICGFPSHCVANMKLQLTVLADGSPIPSPTAPSPASAPGISSIPVAASGPGSSASGPSTGTGTENGKSGASGVRSFPAVILGALFAGCAFLFI